MSMSYENQRVHFEKIVIHYKEYVKMYRILNRGSVEGITPFAFFYWQTVYFSKHDGSINYDRGY